MKFCKLEKDLNVMPFLEEVLSHQWNRNNKRSNIPVQKHTSTIALIKGVQESGKDIVDSNLVAPDPILNEMKITQNFFSWFITTYGGHIARAMYVKLPPKKVVYTHADVGEYYKDKDRFHFVLCGECDITVGSEEHNMKQGDLIWFDNKDTHSVINRGEMDRINLIFDVIGSNWREVVNSDSNK